MSHNMFSNLFGKGFKKFANIFWKNSPLGPLDINKDQNIINNLHTKSNSSDDTCLIKNFNSNTNINSNETSHYENKFQYWGDSNSKVKKDDLDFDLVKKNKPFQNSYNNHLCDFHTIKYQSSLDGENTTSIPINNFSIKSDLIPNCIKNRVCEAIVQANFPKEDRHNAIQLKNLDGYFLTVLDGHGGDEVADYASKELHKKFDQKYIDVKNGDMMEHDKIKISMEFAFEQLEKELYTKALEKYKNGEGKYAYMGSCVLCVLVHNNNIYVANLGDSKAKLFRKIKTQSKISYIPVKLTNTHNAGKYMEQKRLKEKFSDHDIIVEKGMSCYVKGRLQPTRTLGDFYLKYKEFNDPPENLPEKYLKRVIDDFKGPYIDHVPEITNYELTEEDEFLVLATDGLWDFITGVEAANIITVKSHDKSEIANLLWKHALSKATSKFNLDLEQLYTLPDNMKRSIHDDMSILVVDLKNQFSAQKFNYK